MSYSKDTDVIEYFSCEERAQNDYRLTHVMACIKALSLSNRTALRTNRDGWLSVQFMIPLPESPHARRGLAQPGLPVGERDRRKRVGFVEMYVSPLVAQPESRGRESGDESDSQASEDPE